MKTYNKIVVGAQTFTMTKAYLEGVKAFRADKPCWDNPYDEGTATNDDWNYGYENEEAGEHNRFDRDLIEDPQEGKTFGEDPEHQYNVYRLNGAG